MTTRSEKSEMNIQRPTLRYEFNLNTIVQLVGFAAIIWGFGQGWGNLDSRVKELEEAGAKRDQQIATLQVDTRKYDNLVYRVTVVEQASAAVTQKIDALQQAVNDQSGDIRVMREILQRIENQAKAAGIRIGMPPAVARAVVE